MAVLSKGTIDNGGVYGGALVSTEDIHRLAWYCRYPYPEYTFAVILESHLTGCTITIRDRDLNVISTGTAFFDNSWTAANPVQYRYGVKVSRNITVYPYSIFPSTTASLPCYVDLEFTGTPGGSSDPGVYYLLCDQSGGAAKLPWEGSSVDAHPDSIHTKHTLTHGGTASGSIGAPQDMDGFNVDLSANRATDISVLSASSKHLSLKLYNRTSGAVLAETGAVTLVGGKGKFTLTSYVPPSTGKYYLRVFDDGAILASYGGPVGYTVMVRDYVAPAAPPPPPPKPSPVLTQPQPTTTTTTTTTTPPPSTSGGTVAPVRSSANITGSSGYNNLFTVGGVSITAAQLLANIAAGYIQWGVNSGIGIFGTGNAPLPSRQPGAVTTSSSVTVTTHYPDAGGEVVDPPIPPVQYILQRLASHGWKTHARSVDPLNAGEFIDYTVGDGAIGACVAIGLRGMDGQMISRFSHGLIADGQGIRIYEGGREVRTIRSVFTGATKIRIYRHQDNTIAYVVTVGGETLIHTSEKMSDWPGKFPLYVYGYLYSSGDKITSAALTAGEVQYARC